MTCCFIRWIMKDLTLMVKLIMKDLKKQNLTLIQYCIYCIMMKLIIISTRKGLSYEYKGR